MACLHGMMMVHGILTLSWSTRARERTPKANTTNHQRMFMAWISTPWRWWMLRIHHKPFMFFPWNCFQLMSPTTRDQHHRGMACWIVGRQHLRVRKHQQNVWFPNFDYLIPIWKFASTTTNVLISGMVLGNGVKRFTMQSFIPVGIHHDVLSSMFWRTPWSTTANGFLMTCWYLFWLAWITSRRLVWFWIFPMVMQSTAMITQRSPMSWKETSRATIWWTLPTTSSALSLTPRLVATNPL